MNKSKVKSIVILFFAIILILFQTISVIADQNDSNDIRLKDYKLAGKTNQLSLYYKNEMASIAIKDNSNDFIWYSQLPQDVWPKEGITDIIKQGFESIVNISYTKINKVLSTKEDFPLEALEYECKANVSNNKVIYTISIPEIRLAFDIEISIENDVLSVTIPDEKINEGKDAEQQLKERLDIIYDFISFSKEISNEMGEDKNISSDIRKYSSRATKQLNKLENSVKQVDSVIRIESVSDKLGEEINNVQELLDGTERNPGFFMRVSNANVSDKVKQEYSNKRVDFDRKYQSARRAVSALKIIDVGSLVSIELLPYFGASHDKTEGYMLYPNGTGAISEFREKHSDYSSYYKESTYSAQSPDLDWEKSIDKAGLKRTHIPYYGVKQNNNAFIAYVSDGKGESSIQFYPSGYVFDINRVSSSFTYRRTVAVGGAQGEWTGGETPSAYEEKRVQIDATVKFMFLNNENADYSGMARRLNKYMIENNILSKSDLIQKEIPLALDFLGGYYQDVLVFKNYIELSAFKDIQSALESLKSSSNINVPLFINLIGYRSSGYGVYPADNKIAKGLGGLQGLRELSDYLMKNNGELFLQDNPVEALFDQKGYNEGDLAISNYYRVINSYDKKSYILSPKKALERFLEYDMPLYSQIDSAGVNLDRIGSFLYYDYSNKNFTMRQQSIEYWQQMMESVKKTSKNVAVNGANEYVMQYADWIRNVPTSSSGYLYTDYDVPFYQMLIHGIIPYTSEPINQFYDHDEQFLKMVEYGSIPYFALSINEIDSKDIDIYLSTFESYYETIIESYNRYSKELLDVYDQQIINHNKTDSYSVVEYENGNKVYVNYSNNSITIDGVKINAKDFTVKKAKGGSLLVKDQKQIDKQREPSGLRLFNSVGNWIFPVLLVPIILFIGLGLFFNYRRS